MFRRKFFAMIAAVVGYILRPCGDGGEWREGADPVSIPTPNGKYHTVYLHPRPAPQQWRILDDAGRVVGTYPHGGDAIE